MTATVRVNRKAALRVQSGHPWIFQSDIVDAGDACAGDVVRVMDHASKPLGTAHYSSTSQITLRFLSRQAAEDVDGAFYLRRLMAAAELRKLVVRDSEAYRLVHAEGDFLPGLIVDRYGEYLVLQALDQGMNRAMPEIVSALVQLCAPLGILARNDAAVRAQEFLPREVSVLHGEIPESIHVKMNGLKLHADLAHGQKTGIYLDQRENYAAAARLARGQALDCFTSTGGFALHLAARCERVEAVDSGVSALAMARRNAEANGIGNVEFREADVFELLSSYASARRQFDTVILDPPAFAKSRKQIEGAVRGYKDINLRAMRLLRPGGLLVTCSCSHHVSEAQFLELVAEASLDAGRTVRVLERRMQAQDHPVLLTVPETLYLKCLVLQVL